MVALKTEIIKWEQTSDNFTGKIIDGEKQKFLLLPNHPELGSIFEVTGEVYISDPDTDFILDVLIKTAIQFTPVGTIPTLRELYYCYVKAKLLWNIEILKESVKKGVRIKRKDKATPYEDIEEYLKTCLQLTYHQN
jgi:hypothetical protein